jgi:energy-coupling factor transport system permease protein
LMLMIELSLILTATTKPLDLTYALEWYLTPLKWIGFPSHIVAMTITLALRFIPTILEDVDRIMKAQASRGVDFEHGKLGAKFRAIISLIVPLFVSSFIRSDDLANAMECRGYDPKVKRTRYRKLRFSWWDLLETLVVIAFATAFIYASATHFDAFVSWWGIGVHAA